MGKCPLHNLGENTENNVFSDDEDEGDYETIGSHDNGNSDDDKSMNMHNDARKGGIDERASNEQCSESAKNKKKGNKNGHQRTTKKASNYRKKVADCCLCPTIQVNTYTWQINSVDLVPSLRLLVPFYLYF